MTLDQIKEELAAMPDEQQNHLMAFLVHLRHSRDPQFQADAALEIDQEPLVSADSYCIVPG